MSAERKEGKGFNWSLLPVVGFFVVCAAAWADSQGYSPGDIDLSPEPIEETVDEDTCRVKVDEITDTLGSLALGCMPGAPPEERQAAVNEVVAWQNGGSLEARMNFTYDFPEVPVAAGTTTTEP